MHFADILVNERRILRIGAHPADELFVAPSSARSTPPGRRSAFSSLRVASKGRATRPEGCDPDLACHRSQMQRSTVEMFATAPEEQRVVRIGYP